MVVTRSMQAIGVVGEKLLLRSSDDDKVYVFPMVLHTIDTCALNECDKVCAITQETFETIHDNSMNGDCTVYRENPEICLAELPCKHIFSLYHMIEHAVICGMRCPLCRDGDFTTASVKSVPYHMRGDLYVRLQRIAQEKRNEIEEEIQRLRNEFDIRSPATLQNVLATLNADLFSNENLPIYSSITEGRIIREGVIQFHITPDNFDEIVGAATYENIHQIRFNIKIQNNVGQVILSYELSPLQMIPLLISRVSTIFNVHVPLNIEVPQDQLQIEGMNLDPIASVQTGIENAQALDSLNFTTST